MSKYIKKENKLLPSKYIVRSDVVLKPGSYVRAKENQVNSCILTKLTLILLSIYEGWAMQAGFVVPYLLQILTVLLVVFCALEAHNSFNHAFNDPVFLCWFAFGIYSFMALAMRGDISSDSLTELFRYFAFLAVCYCAACVTFEMEDIKWLFFVIITVVIMSCYQALFHGASRNNSGYQVVSMGDANNPNNLGLTMAIGMSVLLFPWANTKEGQWVFRLPLILLAFLVMINAGSRSGLLCTSAVIVLCAVSWMRRALFNSRSICLSVIGMGLLLLAIAFILPRYIGQYAIQDSGLSRLQNEFQTDAYHGRTDLYKIGLDIFWEHPLFGVGYGRFKEYVPRGYYSHSTYIELLSCSGVVGFILFEIPFVRALILQYRLWRSNSGNGEYGFILLVLFFVSGFFGIVYYEIFFMLVFYMGLSDSNTAYVRKLAVEEQYDISG